MGRVDNSARIAAAITVIESGEIKDYSKAVAKFGVDRTSISKRIHGITRSHKEATSLFRKCLIDEQEELLVSHINKLTDRGQPPTSSIVRNLAEEIRGDVVGKNWTGQFVCRNSYRLKCPCLRNIDNLRVIAEYASMFTLFFTLIGVFLKYVF